MEAIKKYLTVNKLTQTAFAIKCKITPGRLSQILRGEDPSLSLIRVMEKMSDGAIRANDFTDIPTTKPTD